MFHCMPAFFPNGLFMIATPGGSCHLIFSPSTNYFPFSDSVITHAADNAFLFIALLFDIFTLQ